MKTLMTKEQVKHTPGKWFVEPKVQTHQPREAGFTFYEICSPDSAMWLAKVQTFKNSEAHPDADGEGRANAELICRAVNSHEPLVRAVAVGYLVLLCGDRVYRIAMQSELCRLRDALSSATGREPQDIQDSFEHAELQVKLGKSDIFHAASAALFSTNSN
jgi:hypothetical protein